MNFRFCLVSPFMDCPEYTLIEYAYYLMAIDSGITMNECRTYESGGAHHFMTKRFDRANGKKIHMQSLGALAHISYQEPGVCGYELAAMYMNELGLAYDITFSYDISNKWLRAHQMTVNEKTNEIGFDDLLAAGDKMGIKEKKCKDIIGEVRGTVCNFSEYAQRVGIREETADYICSIIRLPEI